MRCGDPGARLRMHVTLQHEYAKPVWAGVSPEAKVGPTSPCYTEHVCNLNTCAT